MNGTGKALAAPAPSAVKVLPAMGDGDEGELEE